MILLALLIIAILFFLALVALYISFTLGVELQEENEALQNRLKQQEKEIRYYATKK
jgi:hypothetical protein